MTELLNQDRLRLIAVTIRHPALHPARQTPTLRWAIDAETGRPVARWELGEKPAQPVSIRS
jgi:hypothetical protein